jgi:phage tail-like protein
MSLHSHAAYLPVTHQPPHDPRSLPLNQRVGWRLAALDNMEVDACGHLALSLQPASRRSLHEASGAMAGLQLPKYLAYTPDCGVLLLDREHSLLKKFDPCDCRFLSVPCTGGSGSGTRQFDQPQAIAICGDNLLVADSGNHRLLVYSLLGFLVRGIWSPPAHAISQPWMPVDVAVSQDRKVLVADPNNGCVHMFNFAGRWLKKISGLGALHALAVDRQNRLYVIGDPLLPVTVYDLHSGERLGEAEDINTLADHFDAATIAVDTLGSFDLGWLCALYNGRPAQGAEALWFDAAGENIAQPSLPAKKYHSQGTAWSQPLDSRLYRCQWDRLAMQLHVPRGTRVKISSFSAETELTTKQIQALDDDQWLTRQWIFPEENSTNSIDWDCLLSSAPGRLLWLKIQLSSDALSTPTICNMQVDFPRISLARYLPAVFSAEPRSADFTDRFLAVFDRGFRQMEQRIDSMAALFDPLSAPAAAGTKDFLSWLASWIGVSLDRQLPLATRRRLVKNAAHLYRCRGTLGGLRHMLDLYLGFSSRHCASQPDCRPCSVKPAYQWQPPQLILEHFVLRRWLFVGYGKLGEQARLWGQKIVNRSQLSGEQTDGNAQLGVTRLNTRQDPLRDPFHVYAHKFSLFLPAWVGRLATYRRTIDRLVNAEKPAHSQSQIVYVEPRFRIGIQSMIGFDAVIGCYPRGITLDSSLLGKASVLSEQDNTDTGLRVGDKATIGSTTRLL